MIAFYSFGANESIRLPHKNYKMLYGKEMCRYTFDFIKSLNLSFLYYVFTDSDIIKSIAREYGFNVVECSKESREGLEGSKMVHRIIGADKYFNFPFTSPIRDEQNVLNNIQICLSGNINFAYTANLNELLKPKATGSMWYWTKEQLLNPVDYNTVVLPDWFDFDIDYQEDFDRVEKYLRGIK